jgi:DNA-binding PadR family transcriptional regulator
LSLPHAILTALLEKPSSGLDLARRFDKSIGHFWSATHQQIYREMGKLEAAGLIRAREEAAATQGQRKTYEVLPPGRTELARWVSESQDPRPLRDPLFVRIRAAAMVGTGQLGAELERHLSLHREALAHYLEIERRDFSHELTDAARLQYLVLRGGIELQAMWTEWLTTALETVREVDR